MLISKSLEKSLRCGLGGRVEYLRRGTGLNNLAVFKKAHRVSYLLSKAHLVSGQEHRHSLLCEVLDESEYLGDQFGIERKGGLCARRLDEKGRRLSARPRCRIRHLEIGIRRTQRMLALGRDTTVATAVDIRLDKVCSERSH